jgi:hypothetical protein
MPPTAAINGSNALAEAGELADVEFAFEFETDVEEEDRHQAVVDPVGQAQAADLGFPEGDVAAANRRIADDQREQGAGDEDDAARLLGRKKSLERFRQFFSGQ